MVEQSEFVGRVLRLLAPLGEAHDALAAARRNPTKKKAKTKRG